MSMLKITTSNSPLLKDLETLMITYQDKDYNISLSKFNKVLKKNGYNEIQIYDSKNINKACEEAELSFAEVIFLCENGVIDANSPYFSTNFNKEIQKVLTIDEDDIQRVIDTDENIKNDLINMLETIDKEENNMEETLELLKCEDKQHSLVAWKSKGCKTQFVVCSYFNANKPVGSQWDWGHYYWNINDALEYMLAQKYITPEEIMSINYKEVE